MTISKEAKKLIRKDVTVRAALMAAFEMSEKSVTNWLDRDDIRLTTPKAVETIAKASGLSEDKILVKEAIA